MSWKPKSNRMLVSIGKKNITAARRKVGDAWRFFEEMQVALDRAQRKQPLSTR